jgi:N6-L-threonylcarbamoyladenine synthase
MQNKYDIAASFQYTIGEIIINRVENAFDMAESCTNLVIAGGVGANQYIRNKLIDFTINNGINFFAPPMHLCTDNAAMIAWAAIEHVQAGISPSSLDFEPRASWPLYR